MSVRSKTLYIVWSNRIKPNSLTEESSQPRSTLEKPLSEFIDARDVQRFNHLIRDSFVFCVTKEGGCTFQVKRALGTLLHDEVGRCFRWHRLQNMRISADFELGHDLRVTVTIGKHGSQGGFLNSSITREFNAASSSANVKARSPTEAVDV